MRRFSFLMASLLAAGSVQAGGAGSTGAPFLKVPINARGVGMAGAYTAINGDVTTMEYNPAGLAGIQRGDISLTYIDHLEDTSFQSAGFAFPFGKSADAATQSFAFKPGRLGGGFLFRQFSADDDARNEVGARNGSIGIRDQAFQGGISAPVNERLAFGAAVKYLSQRLDNESLTNFAFDAGVLWRGANRATLGASLLNLGPAKGYGGGEKDPLPLLLRAGAARPFGPLLLAVDLTQGRDKVTRLAAAGEGALGKYVKLRGGVFQQTGNLGFSAGLGVIVPGPLKSPPSALRRGSAPQAAPTSSELVFNERRAADLLDRLNALAVDLTERFHKGGRHPADFPLVVLPAAGAGARMGSALADLLGQQLQREFPVVDGGRVDAAIADMGLPAAIDDEEAARLGRILKARAVVIQQLTRSRDSYSLHDRIVLVESGDAAAAASIAFPTDSFRNGRAKSAATPAAQESAASGDQGRVDWGVDYGLTSRDDLGISHTISLRILY